LQTDLMPHVSGTDHADMLNIPYVHFLFSLDLI